MNYLLALQEWLRKYVIEDVFISYAPDDIVQAQNLIVIDAVPSPIQPEEFMAGTASANIDVRIVSHDDASAIALGNKLYRALRDNTAPWQFAGTRLLSRRMDTLPARGDNEMGWPQLNTTLTVKFVDINQETTG